MNTFGLDPIISIVLDRVGCIDSRTGPVNNHLYETSILVSVNQRFVSSLESQWMTKQLYRRYLSLLPATSQ